MRSQSATGKRITDQTTLLRNPQPEKQEESPYLREERAVRRSLGVSSASRELPAARTRQPASFYAEILQETHMTSPPGRAELVAVLPG
ncbi:hypothetical protein Taro_014467 [Colocasia esculenta]|uniref:Uncharacterized protein n=1 Tax=Colocasia esculenta TaxID=4460 RepID=A0A843UIV3_COLES|nr:hypothetical protein [Colocasia esculenta]